MKDLENKPILQEDLPTYSMDTTMEISYSCHYFDIITQNEVQKPGAHWHWLPELWLKQTPLPTTLSPFMCYSGSSPIIPGSERQVYSFLNSSKIIKKFE